jgi:hypothetical protein
VIPPNANVPLQGSPRLNERGIVYNSESVQLQGRELFGSPTTDYQRSFFESYANLEDPIYLHIWRGIRLRVMPNVQGLQQCIESILRRHDALRSTFVRNADGVLESFVQPRTCVPIDLLSPQDLDLKAECEMPELVAAYARRRFDLENGPLLRVGIIVRSEGQIALTLVFHHNVSDGQSLFILLDELASLYAAYSSGESLSLADLPIKFRDFVSNQMEWLNSLDAKKKIAYWRRKLARTDAPCWLPPDRRSPIDYGGRPYRTQGREAAPISEAIRKLGHSGGTSSFIVALSAFAILMYQWSGRSDTVVWVCHGGRRHAKLARIVGCFLDMWPLRVKVDPKMTFLRLMQCVLEDYLTSHPALDVPGHRISTLFSERASGKGTPMNYFNFFPIGWTNRQRLFAPHTSPASEFHDLPIIDDSLYPDNGYLGPDSGNSFNLNFYERLDGVRWGIRHDPVLFEDETVASMSRQYGQILKHAAADPATYVGVMGLRRIF